MSGLATVAGQLRLPRFIPVTTFDNRFVVDRLLQPHLPRFSSCFMSSYYYAPAERLDLACALFVDSGGFAGRFEGSRIEDRTDHAVLISREGQQITPQALLSRQHAVAQIGATLDFPIQPDGSLSDHQHRQQLTINNATWAIRQPQPSGFRLFASLQAWNEASARRIMSQLAEFPFDGFALGGMVARMANPVRVLQIVDALRTVETGRPLHVFGIGNPHLIRRLIDCGVDSVDSSSYVRQAVNKRYLDPDSAAYLDIRQLESPGARCPCRVCQRFDATYLSGGNAWNTFALALHNLAATMRCVSCYEATGDAAATRSTNPKELNAVSRESSVQTSKPAR